ncbi:antibiotic biosynthesis monooxygenase family protein [Geodermatophilus sp. SYSU D00708]
MYARTTTIRGNPGAIDDATAYLRDEVMPAVQAMDGFVGISLLTDRDTGRCIVTTAWQTEEAMRATMDRVGPLRDRAAQILGGQPEVRGWEIAVLHRVREAPAGARVRVTWPRIEPARVDELLETYRMGVLPRLEDMEGFCSASMLLDRREGLGAGAVTFADRAALDRSRDPAAAIRERTAREMGMEFLDVAEFELALAHLRVPETV